MCRNDLYRYSYFCSIVFIDGLYRPRVIMAIVPGHDEIVPRFSSSWCKTSIPHQSIPFLLFWASCYVPANNPYIRFIICLNIFLSSPSRSLQLRVTLKIQSVKIRRERERSTLCTFSLTDKVKSPRMLASSPSIETETTQVYKSIRSVVAYMILGRISFTSKSYQPKLQIPPQNTHWTHHTVSWLVYYQQRSSSPFVLLFYLQYILHQPSGDGKLFTSS